MTSSIRRAVVAGVLCVLAGSAAAHPGHDATGLVQGLLHPFGIDHLLAMVAVGLWSISSLQGRQRVAGPLAFLSAMLVGACAGASGTATGLVDIGIAASVLAMGLLLLAGRRLAPATGLAVVGIGGLLHGWAHGAEWTAGAGFAAYAVGFVATTSALHAGGLLLGLGLERLKTSWAWGATGTLLGVAGLALLTQV